MIYSKFRGEFDPAYPCRVMNTRACPAIYDDVCGDRPCARYESEAEAPWYPEVLDGIDPAQGGSVMWILPHGTPVRATTGRTGRVINVDGFEAGYDSVGGWSTPIIDDRTQRSIWIYVAEVLDVPPRPDVPTEARGPAPGL